MAQDYLNIIGNWSSAAQQGRNRANAMMETKMKTIQNEIKNQELKDKNEALAEKRISDISAQAEALAKFYRPDDLEKMKVVEEDAKAKLKEQLNMYNDDITAFMRSGGREAINEYRDSVLNSEEAQIIRNNHQSLLKYMDQMDENPNLISDRDRENYHLWKESKVDAFNWSGAYQQLLTPTNDEIKQVLDSGGTLAEAWLHKSTNDGGSNYDRILHNYLIDTGIEFGADGKSPQDYYQELLIYQNNKLGPAEMERAKDVIGDVDASKKSYAGNMQSILNSVNGEYIGDFDAFWYDPANNAALKNLEQVAWINPYDHEEGGRNKRLYGQRMFIGEERAIAKEFFPDMEDGVVLFEDLEAMQSSLGAGGVYNEDGELIPPGESEGNDGGFTFGNDNWDVHGIELMFEVQLNGETKLMSKDDLEDPSIRDRKKKAVMVMSFEDTDGANASDFRYMKLDLDSPRVSKKIDKVLGELEFSSKQNIKNLRPTYRFQKGELFKWTPDNVNGLVPSLDPSVNKVFSQHNFTEYDINASSVLMATSMMNNELENPYLVLQELASTQDPKEKALIEALKEGDFNKYYDLLTSYGATEKDIRELIDNSGRIKMGYLTYGDRMALED